MLWDAFEPGLGKMFVKRKRLADALEFHDYERKAVGQRITLVRMAAEITPRLCKHGFTDMYKANRLAVEQRSPMAKALA